MNNNEALIQMAGLRFAYAPGSPDAPWALDGIDLSIGHGEYVALIGANGSGKSTLLRHLNALLTPTEGRVNVAGRDTRDRGHWRAIRTVVSMVFQVPDRQIVGTTVEEDIAFGLENLGMPRSDLLRRVEESLDSWKLTDLRHRPPHLLSSGQKQRLAIASAMAVGPRCLALDEPTAMLDPAGRVSVMNALHNLHRGGTAIVLATHDMAEAAQAERLIVLSQGRIVLQGPPREVFRHADELHRWHLAIPQSAQLAQAVAQCLPGFPSSALNAAELVDHIADRWHGVQKGAP